MQYSTVSYRTIPPYLTVPYCLVPHSAVPTSHLPLAALVVVNHILSHAFVVLFRPHHPLLLCRHVVPKLGYLCIITVREKKGAHRRVNININKNNINNNNNNSNTQNKNQNNNNNKIINSGNNTNRVQA